MRTAALSLIAISLAVVMPPFELGGSAAAQEIACANQVNAAVTHLQEIMASVRSNDYSSINRQLDAVWSSEAPHKARRNSAAVNLGRMALNSSGLQEVRVCAESGTVATGHYRNDLTGAVDEVRIEVTDDAERRVSRVRVRPARWPAKPVNPNLSDSARVKHLDQFVSVLSSKNAFSGAVLVAKKNRLLYSRGFGTANHELGIPISADTPLNVASLHKIVTAVAIMQLVDEGSLSLEDSFTNLLPKAATNPALAAVKLKHLLSHTSGITTNAEKLAHVTGTTYEYSNLNYKYLGDIIEAKTKMRYEDYLRLRIFGPLGMASTSRYELSELSPRLTYSYTYEHLGDATTAPRDRLRLTPNHYMHIYPGGAMGAYWSTANDLLRFATALQAGKLVKPETLALMKEPKTELGAKEYGFGIMRSRGPGIWGHGGDLPGADADLEIYDNGYSAIVLANYDNVNEPVLLRIRSLFSPNSISPSP